MSITENMNEILGREIEFTHINARGFINKRACDQKVYCVDGTTGDKRSNVDWFRMAS